MAHFGQGLTGRGAAAAARDPHSGGLGANGLAKEAAPLAAARGHYSSQKALRQEYTAGRGAWPAGSGSR